MKKIVLFGLLFGLIGCTVSKQEPETIVIYKRQFYESIFEWACYREAAIVAYAKLHNVSREQATIALEKVVQVVKDKEFDAWYEKMLKDTK